MRTNYNCQIILWQFLSTVILLFGLEGQSRGFWARFLCKGNWVMETGRDGSAAYCLTSIAGAARGQGRNKKFYLHKSKGWAGEKIMGIVSYINFLRHTEAIPDTLLPLFGRTRAICSPWPGKSPSRLPGPCNCEHHSLQNHASGHRFASFFRIRS